MTRSERELLRLVALTLAYVLVRKRVGPAERKHLVRIIRSAQEKADKRRAKR